MSNRPELRKRISVILWDFRNNCRASSSAFKWADQILADPDILIKAPNQDLSKSNWGIEKNNLELGRLDVMHEKGYEDAQKDMLSAGFVKVEPKEGKEMNGEFTNVSKVAFDQCIKVNPSNPMVVAQNIYNAIHQLDILTQACDYLVSEHPLVLSGIVAKAHEYLNDIKEVANEC